MNGGYCHAFDVNDAVNLGSVELAIVLHHFRFWLNVNATAKKNFHEGKTWTYQTLKSLQAYMPYFSVKQLERFIGKLVDLGALIKGNFNKNKYDRTCWYTFPLDISRIREMEETDSGNGNPEIGRPIPDTKERSLKQIQQQPTKSAEKGADAPAAVFSCLDEIKDITSTHKEWLSKTYPEQVVKDAVAFTKHPETQIKTTEVKMVTFACKEGLKPPIEKTELCAENKPYAEALEKKIPKGSIAQFQPFMIKLKFIIPLAI